jgi:aspartate kinase
MIVPEVPADHRRNVCAIAHEDHIGRVRVLGVPNRPGIAAELFEPLGRHGISVDVITQVGGNDLGFVLGDGELGRALAAVGPPARALGARVSHADGLAKVSLVGAGMRGVPGTAARVFRTLADTGIDLEMVATSEIRITCVVRAKTHERAVRALHAEFLG